MNNEEKFKFAFVSNSMEIAEIVKAFADPKSENLVIHQATMEEAVPVVDRLLGRGVEVIIGGGATGKFLRQKSELPIVCIARSAIDILRAIMKAKDYGNKIGLNSYESPEIEVDLFENMLNIKIEDFIFSSTAELVKNVTIAKERGIKCIVGSAIVGKIAASMGLESVVVYPGKEVILNALKDARTLAIAKRNERRKSERLRTILEAISEGVIGVDSKGYVNVFNDSAGKYIGLSPKDVLGKPLPNILTGTGIIQILHTGEADIDQIRRVGSKDIFINSLPVIVNGKTEAVISTFKPISRIKNIDQKIIKKHLTKGFVAKYTLAHLKGSTQSMKNLRKKAGRYAKTHVSLMIVGETGTGKEILAQAIHNASKYRDKPFVAVNCSALPESLLESELFGYEEGAFTGAKKGGKTGLFELANEGTIFLDEIADIPKSLQVRLLRVLEEKEIMRLGGDRIIPVNVRILSSSHRDLFQNINTHDFRRDLYFRLAVLRLEIPPLKERLEDISEIVNELVSKHGINKNIITKNIIKKLKSYSWPGNVRELDGLLWRYAVLIEDSQPDEKLLDSLLEEISPLEEKDMPVSLDDHKHETAENLRDMIQRFERSVINKTLSDYNYNRKMAAQKLGISVNTLWRKTKV